MTDNNDNSSTCECFLAYFDIMGFKDTFYRTSHEYVDQNIMSKLAEIIKIFEEIEDEAINKKPTKFTIFSDSVIFVSHSNSLADAKSIISFSEIFLKRMTKAKIPMKGAIAAGEFTFDASNSKFFGKPLIDAYLLAEEMHCYGAITHHSFDDATKSFFVKPGTNKLLRKPIPLKKGRVIHNYINFLRDEMVQTEPRHYISKKLTDEVKKNLLHQFYYSVAGNTRKYLDNTLEVFGLLENDK